MCSLLGISSSRLKWRGELLALSPLPWPGLVLKDLSHNMHRRVWLLVCYYSYYSYFAIVAITLVLFSEEKSVPAAVPSSAFAQWTSANNSSTAFS